MRKKIGYFDEKSRFHEISYLGGAHVQGVQPDYGDDSLLVVLFFDVENKGRFSMSLFQHFDETLIKQRIPEIMKKIFQ